MKQRSLGDITIEDICSDAGFSVGSFYNHFHTKNDIFIELYVQADSFFAESFEQDTSAGNSGERILRYFDFYAGYNQSTGLETVKQLYVGDNKLFIEKGRYMQRKLESYISQGQDQQEITRRFSAAYIAEDLFIAARGMIYHWCLHEGDFDLAGRMRDHLGRLLQSYCPP
ncbi:TetR family transcriptional regulator [Enterobacteriales bacterium SAP-6]|uniref:TetR family transcriptional regulator n=2 Tax=Acerihabitans arboris TaxID=2691583 RepID=A0A845SEG6_9GAMM|nr:TetR family transcriptional regulator [Acerihabitans arboris]